MREEKGKRNGSVSVRPTTSGDAAQASSGPRCLCGTTHLSVCEAREGKPAGAGRPLVCVGRRALSKQRTRNPCRAMRSPWLGLSVGHCGIKLLRRSRDNVSTQSVCMSVRGPSLPPSGIIVSSSTRDSQLRRGAQIISLSLPSVLLHSDSRGRAGRRQGCDNSEYGNKRRHMLDTCSSAAEAVASRQ